MSNLAVTKNPWKIPGFGSRCG